MNDGAIPPVEDVAFALRLDAKKARGLLERLIAGGLVTNDETVMRPHKWDQRQYKSDVSTDRVKRFRQRSKKPPEHVSETPDETPPDTDTEQSVPLTNVNGPVEDFDKHLWDTAKAYVGSSKASLIGKWCRDHGKPAVAAAITQAQQERPADRVEFISGILRKRAKAATADDEMPIC